ncbi:hypothetical protein D5086_008779 [Populus alba]|uniref:Uncharacterized protein n=1 Tax=Populus alba TaxID=43335 RepID=A0ACC4CHP9_POPAL
MDLMDNNIQAFELDEMTLLQSKFDKVFFMNVVGNHLLFPPITFQSIWITTTRDMAKLLSSASSGRGGYPSSSCLDEMSLVTSDLNLEPLIKTSIVIQLVDGSFVYPLGVIEDVLVNIDNFVIPCDFYILDMERDSSNNNTPILFGSTFLKTVNTKIDCGIFIPSNAMTKLISVTELELKPLPDNLKYVFIGDNNTLPVIITKGLTSAQEEKLMKLLCHHKIAIEWTFADIKGISPSMCMHHILLEDNANQQGKYKEG